MIGIILIILSWLMLRLQRRPLSALGFDRPGRRFAELLIGLLVAGAFAGSQFLLTAFLAGFDWVVNPQFRPALLVESLRWNVNSVLFEELLFRGYLLYKAIEYLGARKACLLSAVAFGIYHWFSYEIFGQWTTMLYVLLMTGTFGWMLAWAFARTGSIFLPIGLHLGWNLVTILIFSNGPLGDQWLIADAPEAGRLLRGAESVLIHLGIPLLLVIGVTVLLGPVGKRASANRQRKLPGIPGS